MSEMGPESGGESSAPAAESSGSEAGEGRPAEGGDAPDTDRAGGEGADAEGAESSAEAGADTSSRAEPGENGPAHAEATVTESTPDDGGDSTTAGIEGGESSVEDDAGPADHTEPGENGPAQAEAPGAEDASEEGALEEGEPDESTEPAEPPEPDEPPDDAADLEAVQPDLAEPTALEAPEAARSGLSEPNEEEAPETETETETETEGSGSGETEGAGPRDPEAINPEGSDANPEGSDAEEPDSEQPEDVESVTAESDEDSDEMPEAEDEDSKQPEEPEEPAPVTADGVSDDDAGSDDDGAGSAEGESGTKTEQPPAATTDQAVDQVLGRVNPNYEETNPAYSENCTGVVQANELQRRGFDVQAGPLEPELRSDQGGGGGRPLSTIEQTWGRDFTPGTKPEIEAAFQEPGSRGVVYIRWDTGGGHVFNIENVGGTVRFVDGQTIPPVTDASGYFDHGGQTRYLRLDDLPNPPSSATAKYVQPRSR